MQDAGVVGAREPDRPLVSRTGRSPCHPRRARLAPPATRTGSRPEAGWCREGQRRPLDNRGQASELVCVAGGTSPQPRQPARPVPRGWGVDTGADAPRRTRTHLFISTTALPCGPPCRWATCSTSWKYFSAVFMSPICWDEGVRSARATQPHPRTQLPASCHGDVHTSGREAL